MEEKSEKVESTEAVDLAKQAMMRDITPSQAATRAAAKYKQFREQVVEAWRRSFREGTVRVDTTEISEQCVEGIAMQLDAAFDHGFTAQQADELNKTLEAQRHVLEASEERGVEQDKRSVEQHRMNREALECTQRQTAVLEAQAKQGLEQEERSAAQHQMNRESLELHRRQTAATEALVELLKQGRT